MDYRKMYLLLFDTTSKVIDLLVEMQKETERLYIEHNDAPIELIQSDDSEPDKITPSP